MFIPNEPYQNTLHLINGHVDMLDHTPVEHSSWHMPVTAFLLKFTEAPQDDSFAVSKTVPHIREIVKRAAVTHVRFSLRLFG